LQRYAPCHRALRLVHSLVGVLDGLLSGPDAWKVKNALRLSGHSDLEAEARALTKRFQTKGGQWIRAAHDPDGSTARETCHWCGASHAGPTDDPIVGMDRS
jgi:hypothetical protein